MIVTCAACLTKYNLDNSRISPKGAKVRCSRCQHVFYIVPPPATKEEIAEDLESFEKYHKDLMEPRQMEAEIPPLEKEDKSKVAPPEEEEEGFLFSEKVPQEKGEWEVVSPSIDVEEEAEIKTFKREEISKKKRKGPSLIFVLLAVLILLAFGSFYLWTQRGAGIELSSYLKYPVKKISGLWHQIWGAEKRGLIVTDLSAYDEKIGDIPLLVIEGKVTNSSRFTKKYIKVKVTLFDQDKAGVAEKETLCGRTLSSENLMGLPSDFFTGEMAITPKTEGEMNVPSGRMTPFIVIFKDVPTQAKEFKVEVVEAPNL